MTITKYIEKSREIPIIAMIANAFAEDVQAALNAGMDDHVAKPIDMDILISAVEKSEVSLDTEINEVESLLVLRWQTFFDS